MIEYVQGEESHTSSWGKFYIKGNDGIKVDSPANHRDRHHSYQAWMDVSPTVFSVWAQSGNKYSADGTHFYICQGSTEENKITGYAGCHVTGGFEILAEAHTKHLATRLLQWWIRRPPDVDPVAYAKHLAECIKVRGLKEPTEMTHETTLP